jgi:hypothetical protein
MDIAYFKANTVIKFGVSPDQVDLFFNGIKLDDNHRVRDYCIRKHSTIQMVFRPPYFPLSIQPQGEESFPLVVEPTDTIENLKEKIARTEHFPAYQIALVFNDKLLNDSKSLEFYSITRGSTLEMVISPPSFQILVKTPDNK